MTADRWDEAHRLADRFTCRCEPHWARVIERAMGEECGNCRKPVITGDVVGLIRQVLDEVES